MKISLITCCVFFLLVLNFSSLKAQNANSFADSVTGMLYRYGVTKSQSVLFTCFDKTVYVNNENVWFTSYLLNYDKKLNNPSILSIILVNDYDRSIALERKFIMSNGLSFGHVIIPDTIPPGNYSFITYSNLVSDKGPKDIFIQPITIKSASDEPFNASLKLIDTDKNDLSKILLKIESKTQLPLKEVTASWHIGQITDPVSSGLVKIDQDGMYVFSIPQDQVIKGKNVLRVSVLYNKEVRNIQIVLPTKEEKLHIKFFPEGGNLVQETLSCVGWEAKTVDGAPLRIRAILYRNNSAIDTIRTDLYGMGKFNLIPQAGSKYQIKVIGYPTDICYALPPALLKGMVLNLKRAIINDSLQIKLVSNYPQKCVLIIHNFKQLFYSIPVMVNNTGKKVLINLADVPKGLNVVTVLDSLQRPLSERIFFAHYNQRSHLNIATDLPEYGTRQKVHLKLKLLSTKKDSINGIVTVACVQRSRIQSAQANDIESYYYLKSELEKLPIKEYYMGENDDDKDYLEKITLIKGWRRYKWQEAVNADERVPVKLNQIFISGSVSLYNKPLKKPTNIMVIADSTTSLIRTNIKGDFQLEGRSMNAPEEKKIHLLLSYAKNDGYEISIKNNFTEITNKLIKDYKPIDYNQLLTNLSSTSSQILEGSNHAINLKEVNIVSKRDVIYGEAKSSIIISKRENECGDYVCIYDILNCPNHEGDSRNRPPVIGEHYKDPQHGEGVTYTGCTVIPNSVTNLSINGVSYTKEFYGSDYSQYNPSEPEYQSTIYWKHLLFVDSREKELTFYTSDITGSFDIIVQGQLSDGFIYEKKEFNVKKK
jgi:hypothetical protein